LPRLGVALSFFTKVIVIRLYNLRALYILSKHSTTDYPPSLLGKYFDSLETESSYLTQACLGLLFPLAQPLSAGVIGTNQHTQHHASFSFVIVVVVVIVAAVGFELRALQLLGKCSTIFYAHSPRLTF
jgi:hypothetical protein